MWAVPGAALLDGEAPETAVRRGVEEEMGVPLVRIRSLGVVEHAYTHFTVSVHAFSADVGDGRPASKELIDVRWVPVGSLDDLPMGKVDRAIAIRLAGG
jgi:A/G-specific adenine glycosylase